MINCPNCGAPFDPMKNTCQYCGTSVLDISGLNFDDKHPIFLKFRTRRGFESVIVTQKCIPKLETIEMMQQQMCMPYITTTITFFAIAAEDGSTMKVEVVKE